MQRIETRSADPVIVDTSPWVTRWLQGRRVVGGHHARHFID
ncbi:hypothetical protein [Nitrosospira multiformis]|nr:hypothetical protein [Nitrosospira multiformis]